MKDWFIRQLNKVLYSADQSTVENLLHQLASPEHNLTRWGHPQRSDFRGVVADALSDQDREKEAELLRSGKHVLVRDGRVVPARWTWEHLQNAMSAADHALFHPTVLPPTAFRTTMEISPSVQWLTPDAEPYSRAEEVSDQPHLNHEDKSMVEHENAVPLVGVTDDTCNTEELPITEAAHYFRNELLPSNIDWVAGEGLPFDRDAALNHPLVKAVSDAPLEEPVPEKEPHAEAHS